MVRRPTDYIDDLSNCPGASLRGRVSQISITATATVSDTLSLAAHSVHAESSVMPYGLVITKYTWPPVQRIGSKALGVIGRTDDRHLTQRRERPSPRHASARRKLSLKVGQSLLKARYLRLDQV